MKRRIVTSRHLIARFLKKISVQGIARAGTSET